MRAATNVQRHRRGAACTRSQATCASTLHLRRGRAALCRANAGADAGRAARGGLPPGVRMDLPRTCVEMTGHGELWSATTGYPCASASTSASRAPSRRVCGSAAATVDFARLQRRPRPWTYRRARRHVRRGCGFRRCPRSQRGPAAFLVVGLVVHRRSPASAQAWWRPFSPPCSSPPLLGSSRLCACSVAQVQAGKPRRPARDPNATGRSGRATDLRPPSAHTDPLAAAAAAQAAWDDTNRYFDPSCTTDPAGDMDGDGLTNLQECLLGTLPDVADTDNDNIDDGVEVAGIRLVAPDQSAQTWYLDPLNQDTNHDGLADGHEWYLDANGDNLPDDTDTDGTPDIWDLDNDGDGVPDNLDLSPYATTQGGAAFTDADPFALAVDDLESGRLVKVEFQLSPTDADHLWYTQNVLDWPDDDRQGPIQDADGLTFFDVDPSTDASPNANGDMRMVPMLEIEIPAAANNAAEEDILTQFNISVKQTDADTVTAYVPMQLVTDSVGDKNVAFYGTMFYRAGAAWGAAQPVRLVWLVQALVDQCDSYSNNICDGYSSYNDAQIIQVYDDDWYLTGLHVTEEHSAAMDIVYEDPVATAALDPGYDQPFYMDTLYGLLYGLDNTFLAGADCDSVDGAGDCVGDGDLDMDTAEIERRFNHTTNAGVSADERWNLPNVLDVDRRTYESIDLAMADTTITQTVGVLDTTFTPAWSPSAPITPTIMIAYEQTYRSLNLDETVNGSPNFSWSDAQLHVGFPQSGADAVEPRTMNSVKWTPYAYDPAVGWGMADLDAYYDDLTAQLGVAFSDIADPDEASTEQTMAQVLYVSIYTGENSIVQIGTTNITADYEKADQSIAVTIVADTGTILRKVVSSYYSYTPVLNDIAEAIGPEATTSEVLAQFIYQSTFKYFTTVTGAAQLAFVAVVALVAAAALFAQYVFHDTSAAWSITAAVSVGVLTTIFSIYKPIRAIVSLAQDFAAISEDTSLAGAIGVVLTDGNELLSGSRVAGVIGLVIAVGISVGIFTYLLASGKVHAGTIAFNELLAMTIASVIVAVVLFVLASTIVGSILIGIVSVIDIILLLLGTGWSITGWITNALAGVIYQYNLLEKVDVVAGDLAMDLALPNAGLLAGNRMAYSVPITTSLSSTYGKIEENSLIYDLNENDESLSTNLGARSDDWVVGATDTHLYAYVIDQPTLTSTLRAGINIPTPLVLNTAYALRGQSCWVGFCTSKTLKGRSSDDLGEAIVLDVLPATLTEFVDVATWAGGEVLAVDADGDGLLPFDLGGVDPDPDTWDADGDNLADGYELTIRSKPGAAGGLNLDPLQADTDGDTLRDDAELRAGTDPGNADTDGDGLPDVAELGPDGGWFLAYAPDKQARIWSDPLQSDADGDGLSDFFERSQDTCPDCGPWADPDNPLVYSPVVWNESPVALYVSNSTADNLVKPGASLVYTTTTANNLSAQQRLVGALTLDLPPGFTGAPLDAAVDVSSGSRESLVSNLTVDAGATGPHVLTSSMNLTDLDATIWSWDTPVINSHGALKGSAKGPAIAATAEWTEPYVLVMHEPPGITGYLIAADGSVTRAPLHLRRHRRDAFRAGRGLRRQRRVSGGVRESVQQRYRRRQHRPPDERPGQCQRVTAVGRRKLHAIAARGRKQRQRLHGRVGGGDRGQHSLWLQPVANSGKPQGDPQMFAGPDPELGDIALAWNGAAYLAVWQRGASLSAPSSPRTARSARPPPSVPARVGPPRSSRDRFHAGLRPGEPTGAVALSRHQRRQCAVGGAPSRVHGRECAARSGRRGRARQPRRHHGRLCGHQERRLDHGVGASRRKHGDGPGARPGRRPARRARDGDPGGFRRPRPELRPASAPARPPIRGRRGRNHLRRRVGSGQRRHLSIHPVPGGRRQWALRQRRALRRRGRPALHHIQPVQPRVDPGSLVQDYAAKCGLGPPADQHETPLPGKRQCLCAGGGGRRERESSGQDLLQRRQLRRRRLASPQPHRGQRRPPALRGRRAGGPKRKRLLCRMQRRHVRQLHLGPGQRVLRRLHGRGALLRPRAQQRRGGRCVRRGRGHLRPGRAGRLPHLRQRHRQRLRRHVQRQRLPHHGRAGRGLHRGPLRRRGRLHASGPGPARSSTLQLRLRVRRARGVGCPDDRQRHPGESAHQVPGPLREQHGQTQPAEPARPRHRGGPVRSLPARHVDRQQSRRRSGYVGVGLRRPGHSAHQLLHPGQHGRRLSVLSGQQLAAGGHHVLQQHGLHQQHDGGHPGRGRHEHHDRGQQQRQLLSGGQQHGGPALPTRELQRQHVAHRSGAAGAAVAARRHSQGRDRLGARLGRGQPAQSRRAGRYARVRQHARRRLSHHEDDLGPHGRRAGTLLQRRHAHQHPQDVGAGQRGGLGQERRRQPAADQLVVYVGGVGQAHEERPGRHPVGPGQPAGQPGAALRLPRHGRLHLRLLE
ncbi:MAG: hypothetical protein R2851_02405 [Caldilineaceae bacterium]